jgi:hypothetical protein
MTVSLSLKALAAQVLNQKLDAEQPRETLRNTPREEWNTHAPERSTVSGVCSTFQGHGSGTLERDANVSALRAYYRRVADACSWDDLYALLIDADVDCVEGALTFGDIDTLCGLCRNASDRLPEHSPKAEK